MKKKAVALGALPPDLTAELDALPDADRHTWTAEEDALLCKVWGVKQRGAITTFFHKHFGHPPGATTNRANVLRAAGRITRSYISTRSRP